MRTIRHYYIMADYIKIIKKNPYVISIMYKYNDEYIKVTIASHPDNHFLTTTKCDKKLFDNFGNKYYYDGNTKKLDNILKCFDPECNDIDFLFECLSVHSDICIKKSYSDLFRMYISRILSYFKSEKDFSKGSEILCITF